MKNKEDFNKVEKKRPERFDNFRNKRDNQRNDISEIEFENFFDLDKDNKGLEVLNPYSFEEAMKRIDSLTFDDIKEDLKYFQVKHLELRNYEDINTFSLSNIKFITSSINKDGKKDFYLLNDLSEYLLTEEDLKEKEENEENDKKGEHKKKIFLSINTQDNGKQFIIIKCLIQANILAKNIIDNFLDNSPFEKGKKLKEKIEKYMRNNFDNYNFKLTIRIQLNSINKIYYNDKKGEYFFDL